MMISTVLSRRDTVFFGIYIGDSSSSGRHILLCIFHGAAPLKGHTGLWFRGVRHWLRVVRAQRRCIISGMAAFCPWAGYKWSWVFLLSPTLIFLFMKHGKGSRRERGYGGVDGPVHSVNWRRTWRSNVNIPQMNKSDSPRAPVDFFRDDVIAKAPIQTWCHKSCNNQPRTPYATSVPPNISPFPFAPITPNILISKANTSNKPTNKQREAEAALSLLHPRLPLPPLPRNLPHHLPQQPVRGVHVGGERLEPGHEGLDLRALGLDFREEALVLGLGVLELGV